MGDRVGEGGQLLDRIEGAREEGQRQQHKVGNRLQMIKFFRPDACDNAKECEHQRRPDCEEEDGPDMGDTQADKGDHGDARGGADDHAARHTGGGDGEVQLTRRQGRHQIIHHVALHF